MLRVASTGFSDIKHRNEHSLFFCTNLKALPVFKNIHIYGQEESLQLLLVDESFNYFTNRKDIKGEMDLWQRKVTDRSTAQSNLLDSLPQLEWTQSLLMSPGKAAVGVAGEGF